MSAPASAQTPASNRILRLIEPLVFAQRPLTLLVLLLVTLFLGWQASRVEVDAGFEKSIPLDHPYMQVFREHQRDFGGANIVLVALIRKDGKDIYDADYLAALRKLTDDVFFLPGVDRSRLSSIFTPNIRYIEVVEGGFKGGPVIPDNYAPTPEGLARVRGNIEKSGIQGRLVASDYSGALVQAELLEIDPDSGAKLDYREVANKLEALRARYADPRWELHIIGFAKVIGDVSDATVEVVGFFLITLLLTYVLLWFYTRSLVLALVPLGCSVVAVIWEFGLLRLFGYGLDPFAILVPFLILSVSVSHGVQYVSSWASEARAGLSGLAASVSTFRKLAIVGTVAILTDVAGFATIWLVPIDIIREMAVNATLGMTAIIITNKVLCPIWLSYLSAAKHGRAADAMESRYDGLWHRLAVVTERGPAMIALGLGFVLLAVSVALYPQVKTGDAKPNVPELRPDSRYNRDSQAIVDHFAIGVDLLKVIAVSTPDACVNPTVMREIDRFGWHLANVPGVQSVLSLAEISKLVNSAFNEGLLNDRYIPDNKFALVQAVSPIPTGTGLLDKPCARMPVFVFTADHKAETIQRVVNAVKDYQQLEAKDLLRFELGTGNLAVMAATNEVVKAKEWPMLGLVYLVIIAFVWASFRSWVAVVCIILPLSLVSMMAYALMALLDIGLKTATLPVVSLAVGIGVDYGIYIYATLVEEMKRGDGLRPATARALSQTGRAVIFTGLSLGLGTATWLFSGLQFQADMGALLVFMFTGNMLGAIFLLPAIARFLPIEGRSK